MDNFKSMIIQMLLFVYFDKHFSISVFINSPKKQKKRRFPQKNKFLGGIRKVLTLGYKNCKLFFKKT